MDGFGGLFVQSTTSRGLFPCAPPLFLRLTESAVVTDTGIVARAGSWSLSTALTHVWLLWSHLAFEEKASRVSETGLSLARWTPDPTFLQTEIILAAGSWHLASLCRNIKPEGATSSSSWNVTYQCPMTMIPYHTVASQNARISTDVFSRSIP